MSQNVLLDIYFFWGGGGGCYRQTTLHITVGVNDPSATSYEILHPPLSLRNKMGKLNCLEKFPNYFLDAITMLV